MDIISTYKFYSNVNRTLTYLRYFKNTKSGKYIDKLISNFDNFFEHTCLQYNNFMFSTEATKISLDMITDYHLQSIIELGSFPTDLEEDLSEHFENNWYLRLSLKPFKKLIGKTLFSRYSDILLKEQKIFNKGLEFNPYDENDEVNEIGNIIYNNVIEAIMCSRIYYGSHCLAFLCRGGELLGDPTAPEVSVSLLYPGKHKK